MLTKQELDEIRSRMKSPVYKVGCSDMVRSLLKHIEELEAENKTLIDQQEKMAKSFEKMGARIKELESQIISWIPASDSRPLDCQHVLICGSTGAIRSAVWHDYITGGLRSAGFSPEDDWSVRIIGVTHWAKLPAPPKEEPC